MRRSTRSTLFGMLLTLIRGIAGAQGNAPAAPSVLWREANVFVDRNGNFVGAVGAKRIKIDPARLHKDPALVTPFLERFPWKQVEDDPLGNLPCLTEAHLSELIGQPCVLEQSPTHVLLRLSDPTRVMSTVRREADENDVTLDNVLVPARKSVAYVRYRSWLRPADPPHDLLLVRLDFAKLYADLLTDHLLNDARNLVGFLDTSIGPLLVFDTRLAGSLTTELDLVGGGLSNSILYNLLRVHAERPSADRAGQVIVEVADKRDLDSLFENLSPEAASSLRSYILANIARYFSPPPNEQRTANANKDGSDEDAYIARYEAEERQAGRSLEKGNILEGHLQAGVVQMELRDLENTVVATTTLGADARGGLSVPAGALSSSHPTLFTLIVHHPWARDIVRPVVVPPPHP